MSQDEESPGAVRIELRPHCALTPQSARIFFIATAVLCLTVASAAAAHGAWPAPIFATAELLVLGWALSRSLKRGRDSEVLEVSEDHVNVRIRTRTRQADARFLRHWAHVKLQYPVSRLQPAQLFIECQGHRCEVGSFLTESERKALAGRLTDLIGRTADSPRLANVRDAR